MPSLPTPASLAGDPNRSATWIAISYVVIASAWILVSDTMLGGTIGGLLPSHLVQTIKGISFVVVSGALLYLLMRWAFKLTTQAALTDRLCDLPNRESFTKAIASRCNGAVEPGHRFSVTIIDLDHFAVLNDAKGHLQGDWVLALLGKRISQRLDSGWFIARLGGDEFGLMSPVQGDPASTMASLDRVLEGLTKESGDTLLRSLTVSAGTSYFPDHGKSTLDLMRNADMALLAAKSGGRARHNIFQDQLREDLIERVSLVQDLKHACENNTFSVVYQPLWSTALENWHGAEVLIRWEHPTRGFVPPDVFIPLAEQEGLILPITKRVVAKALQEISDSRITRHHLPQLSLNLSHAVLIDNEAMNDLLAIIQRQSNDLPQLVMEITETSAVKDLDAALGAIQKWRLQGIEFSIDDFGTGYSSLARLKEMAVAEVKIDRKFVEGLPGDKDDAAITKAILAMAKALSLRTVAEGVETQSQAQYLAAHGCSILQGYYFAKPEPIGALTDLIHKQTVSIAPDIAKVAPI